MRKSLRKTRRRRCIHHTNYNRTTTRRTRRIHYTIYYTTNAQCRPSPLPLFLCRKYQPKQQHRQRVKWRKFSYDKLLRLSTTSFNSLVLFYPAQLIRIYCCQKPIGTRQDTDKWQHRVHVSFFNRFWSFESPSHYLTIYTTDTGLVCLFRSEYRCDVSKKCWQ